MLKKETVEEFINLMTEHELIELDVADGDQRITLKRSDPCGSGGGGVAYVSAAPAVAPAASGSAPVEGTGGGGGEVIAAGATIDSPMVGTFYSRPNPDAEPFVSVGSKVSSGTVVCLVEAMKVFNEIKAECAGEIAEVLVADGDPVEYGQAMFRLKA